MNDSTSAISPDWPTRWPKDSFRRPSTWVVTALLLLLVLAASLAALKQGPVAPMSPLLLDLGILLQLVVEAIFAAIVLAVLPALSKFSLRQLGFRLPSAANVGTAILGAVGMVIVANGGASLIDYLLHSQHQQDIVQIFRALHDHTTIVIFAVFAVVFAPFAEETFFRVFFFNLGLRYSGFWGGAVLSGLLFGIAHGDAYAALPLALGGIVLCAVYYRTRNAWAPMISHALFNSVSIVALLFIPKVSQ